MVYLKLLIGFLKVGLFSFGGGYASIPLIRDVVLEYGWLDEDMITYMIAVSESTPGPIMVNLATYVGSSQGGFLGACVATFAVVLPAFVIILLVMSILKKVMGTPFVQAVIRGLIPCIIGIILATGAYSVLKQCFFTGSEFVPDIKSIIMTVLFSVIYFGSRKIKKKGISPIALIGLSMIAGIVIL